jgi:glycosyltransferase involved in cell wall biosynthesis
MGELAFGLDELERRGLAHGDPYPFNAIRGNGGAVWVDFGHLTDDPAQWLKDAWAFVLFTVLQTHAKTRICSASLLEGLADAMAVAADRAGRFAAIRDVLSGPCPDMRPFSDPRTPAGLFAGAAARQLPGGVRAPDLSRLLLKSSAQYFSDFLSQIDRGNRYVTGFHLEKQRHHFVEQEMLRLTVPRGDHRREVDGLGAQLAERESRIASLTRRLAEQESQILCLEQSVSEREGRIGSLGLSVAECQGRISELAQSLADRETRLAEQGRAIGERDGLIGQINEIARSQQQRLGEVLRSRSWRLTRPMRALARIVRAGRLSEADRGRLHEQARRLYHRLPVSHQTRWAMRSLFLKLMGGPPAPVAFAGAAPRAGAITGPFADPGAAWAAVLNARVARSPNASIGLRAAGNRVPYFGIRRKEGARRVALLTNQLVDWTDSRPRFGGGERYALELARLLKDLSFEVTFFQPSHQAPGTCDYYGFKVVLMSPGSATGEFHHQLCSQFTELTRDYDHVYHHLPEYASGQVREDALMTCHGIWFDHDNYPDSMFRSPEWFRELHSAFSSPRGVVSVDTNSIGVIRSLWPELASGMRFIPNFQDPGAYHPRAASRSKERLTVLFPRRSQINRGSRIFGEIVSLIPHDVTIVWLGEGDPVDTRIVREVCQRDPRASFAAAAFDQMPAWYQKADIAVIPTIACEGTSLSCLEALASGCAVVSTHVGGLPDLVYDGMNGLLVDPDPRSIARAINRLIEDEALRTRLQSGALASARRFELARWRSRWVGVLHDCGWISDRALADWQQGNDHAGELAQRKPDRWLILTRNAIHGGVESLIREEARGLGAPVVVCGGHDQSDTCPFEYERADQPKALERAIAGYDVILYHWLPDWCLDVLRRSGKRCIEFVHRTDTASSDKTVPAALITHSSYLARYLHETSGRPSRVVEHPIAVDRFRPLSTRGVHVGAITSYYDTKGIDVFLRAWALINDRFPENATRFYGAGDDLPRYRQLASELGLDVDFRGATREPWEAMKEFACFVVPSRVEGLPVAILEALAMNIPVVASDLPGMVEFNDLAESRGYPRFVHLARVEDPQDLARVIAEVLQGPAQPESSPYISAYYSPAKHCADLVSACRELCK